MFGLGEMAVFIALVFVAYVYVWRKGGLDWSVVTPVEEEIGVGVEEEPSLEAVGAR